MEPHPIVLMRHGRPLYDHPGWIHADAMADWIAGYNGAAVCATQVPAHAHAAAIAARMIVTSTLARATSSVTALGRQADIIDACFDEAELPHAGWRGLKLPARMWAMLFRLAWLCGYRRKARSFAETKVRAAVAAQRLIDLASQGPVLLVGHGIINRMIAAELGRRGWTTCDRQGSAYWHCVSYRRAT